MHYSGKWEVVCEMNANPIVSVEGGKVALPREVLEACGISSGDSVVLYQMENEVHIRKYIQGKIPAAGE